MPFGLSVSHFYLEPKMCRALSQIKYLLVAKVQAVLQRDANTMFPLVHNDQPNGWQ
jgi:hypothetical protein